LISFSVGDDALDVFALCVNNERLARLTRRQPVSVRRSRPALTNGKVPCSQRPICLSHEKQASRVAVRRLAIKVGNKPVRARLDVANRGEQGARFLCRCGSQGLPIQHQDRCGGAENSNREEEGTNSGRQGKSLTFDVRGGPLAERPLDGGVRRHVSHEAPGEPNSRRMSLFRA
jgi:hypothetical protein